MESNNATNINFTTASETHVLRSTRLERMIYEEMRERVKNGLDEIEAKGSAELSTFPELLQDTFVSLYSPNPQPSDIGSLNTIAREINTPILETVMSSDQYYALKSLCEGRELVAYEAVNEFAKQMLQHLGKLFDNKTLDELNACDGIPGMGEHSEQLSRAIGRGIRQANDEILKSLDSALCKAQEASDAIAAWGNGDNTPTAIAQNTEMLQRLQSSSNLRDIIKFLGKYREIYDNARKAAYIFGRGEKYDIVLGNDYTRALSSEYAYLALPETVPLFLQKVQRKTLKQYRKRERISEGRGDIVICIDESGSMSGDPIAWAKTVALVLLEQASRDKRSCAIVRFASRNQAEAHLFREGKHTIDDVIKFAESFFCGGTDFETPLNKAVSVIEDEGFEKADVMFITDGACEVSEEFTKVFMQKRDELNFSIAAVIIDLEGMLQSFCLAPLCKKVYRLGIANGNDIAADIIKYFT